MISPKDRKKIEDTVISVFDKLDKTGMNSLFYKDLFKSMDDKKFKEFISGRLPYRLFYELFKVEPQMDDIFDAYDIIGQNLLEELNMPYLYRDSKGRSIRTKPGMVLYIHLKRMVQLINKKNNITFGIDERDQKSGLLMNDDKGAKITDREFEALAFMNLDHTISELSGPRADEMESKIQMYNSIAEKGYVTTEDIKRRPEDSLSRNLVNSYLIGAHIYTNLLNKDYMTPATIRKKKLKSSSMGVEER